MLELISKHTPWYWSMWSTCSKVVFQRFRLKKVWLWDNKGDTSQFFGAVSILSFLLRCSGSLEHRAGRSAWGGWGRLPARSPSSNATCSHRQSWPNKSAGWGISLGHLFPKQYVDHIYPIKNSLKNQCKLKLDTSNCRWWSHVPQA